jgi:hypothetical protein
MASYFYLVRKISKYIYYIYNGKDLTHRPKEIKEKFDGFAEAIIDLCPIKCPQYQCGGMMKRVLRSPPKDWNHQDGYIGDEQTPDLQCTNCGAFYKFDKYRGRIKN